MGQEETLYVDGREIVLTPALQVRCDGGNGALGHPVEFMTLERDGEVMCKYCGRRYVHTGHPEAATIRRTGVRPAA